MSKIKIEAGNRYNENGLAWELLYFRLAAGTIKQVEKGGHLYCLTMGRIQKKGWVTMQEAKEKVSVQKALLMVGVALLVIIIGKLFLKLDTTLVLFISSTAVSIIAVLFCGTSWNKIEEQISIGIRQMCAGAIVQARIPEVVMGCMNPKAGCAGSILNILEMPQFNHQVKVTRGILETECSQMLKTFFEELRIRNKQEKAARRASGDLS